MDILRQFYGDVHTREAFQAFMTEYVAAQGVKLMFERKDVSHIADAKMLIDGAFEELSILYSINEQSPETTNQAR